MMLDVSSPSMLAWMPRPGKPLQVTNRSCLLRWLPLRLPGDYEVVFALQHVCLHGVSQIC